MKMLQEQVLTADYESCWGYSARVNAGVVMHRSRWSEALAKSIPRHEV